MTDRDTRWMPLAEAAAEAGVTLRWLRDRPELRRHITQVSPRKWAIARDAWKAFLEARRVDARG